VYEYDSIVIGASVESLTYAYVNNFPVIYTHLQKPFKFDCFDPEFDLSLFDLETTSDFRKETLFEHLLFVLSLAGQVPFSDKIKVIEFEEDNSLTVVTRNNAVVRINVDKILVFDEHCFEGIPIPDKEAEKHYKVLDWINVRSGMKHRFDYYKTDDDFVKELYFFPTERVDGNHDKKDVVAVSYMSEEELNNIEYSDSYVRLKVLSLMKQIGIKGRRNGRDVNNRDRIIYRAIKIDTAERKVIPLHRDEYSDYKNLSFIYSSLGEIISKGLKNPGYTHKLNNLLFNRIGNGRRKA
jgi:hypothetical protein